MNFVQSLHAFVEQRAICPCEKISSFGRDNISCPGL